MARNQSDREDLLREATALVERAELQIAGIDEPTIVGFRRTGAASVFFGADPVYQFNTQGELRRAYFRGQLIKAERGRLVALNRVKTEHEVQLVRQELTIAETEAFAGACLRDIAALRSALASGSFSVNGQAPANVDVVARIKTWLESLADPIPIAASPHAR